ncbi:hypothetical protein B0H17DRAFT_1018927 [Mycena rosella]|uniref:Translation initiation factor 3 N-terminal domain-containing protein n=1 Tax=Mycena rosella TaxID=1033263 RepID=A0AAD7G8P8_MYCRO|nr:hypothetical protein B0H17DRAFT_1018927 [Mycena rosella]
MNTFSAFRFAARTLLHPRTTHFPCLNPLALHHVRFKSKRHTTSTRIRNENIPHENVYLVNEENALVKTSLADLLASTDLKEYWVELVAAKPLPVVKLANKKEALVKVKQTRVKAREVLRKNIVKEVQLTWGSEKSDLEHKLARVRMYLEIGAKVDIVFSTKTKGTPPSQLFMQKKLQDTVEMMADVSKEWKPVEWRRNIAAIHLKGIVDVNRQLTPEQIQLVEAEEAEGAELESDEPVIQSEPKAEDIKLVVPPPRVQSRPEPGKPKGYVDLSEFNFEPPPQRRNPGKKPEKQYGTRSR